MAKKIEKKDMEKKDMEKKDMFDIMNVTDVVNQIDVDDLVANQDDIVAAARNIVQSCEELRGLSRRLDKILNEVGQYFDAFAEDVNNRDENGEWQG